MGGSITMVTRAAALPGRAAKMAVSAKHYVLFNQMEGPYPAHLKKMVFANGCFWGSEKGAWRLPGVWTTACGYTAGFTPNPTYEEVCSGQTGHTEAVQVVFDPSKISCADILRWFWESHDPTQGMGQGNDRGTQYRSGLYWFDEERKALILASKDAYEKALGRPITTECASAAEFEADGRESFYFAEDYHQQYLAKPGARPYCSAKPQCVSLPPFESWAPEGMEEHAPKLPPAFWDKYAPTPHCVIRSPHARITDKDF